LRKPGPPRAFGKRAPGRLSPYLVVGRLVMLAVGVAFLVGGLLTGTVLGVVIGAVLVVLEAGLLIFQALAFRASRWPGEPDELLVQVADAALVRLDPAWRYELGTSDGFGATGLRVATFSRDSEAGPTLWFEDPTTFRVTYLLPDGDEVSAEVWRISAADHETLVDVLVALCEGRLTVDGHFAVVETAKRPVKLPVYAVSEGQRRTSR
jgi:hypothetical protein